MKKGKRSSFSFYRNWYNYAVRRTDDTLRLEFYDALFAYAFDGKESKNSELQSIVLTAVEAGEAISNARSKAGRRGGRASAAAKSSKQTQANQANASKPQENIREEKENIIPPTPCKGVGGDDVCPSDEIPPSEVRAELAARRPSQEEILVGSHAVGVPDEFAREFVADMDKVGWVWVNSFGRTVYVSKANWKAVLKSRYDARKKNLPPRAAVRGNGSARDVGDVPPGYDGAPVGTELPSPCPHGGEEGEA